MRADWRRKVRQGCALQIWGSCGRAQESLLHEAIELDAHGRLHDRNELFRRNEVMLDCTSGLERSVTVGEREKIRAGHCAQVAAAYWSKAPYASTAWQHVIAYQPSGPGARACSAHGAQALA